MASSSPSSPTTPNPIDSWYYTGSSHSDIPTEMEKITSNLLDRSGKRGKLIYLDLAAIRLSYPDVKLLAVALRISLTSVVYLRLHPESLNRSEIKNVRKLLFDEAKEKATRFDDSPHSKNIFHKMIEFQTDKTTPLQSKISLGFPNKSIAYFMVGDTNHASKINKTNTLNCIYYLLLQTNTESFEQISPKFSEQISHNSVSDYAFLCLDILKADKNRDIQSLLKSLEQNLSDALSSSTPSARPQETYAQVSAQLGLFERKPLLHLAAIVGKTTAIEYLIDEKKVNVDCPDNQGCTAIELAVTHGQLSSAMTLLERTKRTLPYPLRKNGLHQNLLSLAIRQRDLRSVKKTINKLGIEIQSLQQTKLNVFLLDSFSPIHVVLEEWHQAANDHSQTVQPYIDILTFLINMNDRSCLNRSDSTKGTPLWYALCTKNFQAVRLILSSNSKIDCPIEAGFTTSQHHMVDHAWDDSDVQIEIINLMIENARKHAGNPELIAQDISQRIPLHTALFKPWRETEQQQQIRVIQTLLQNCSETINAQDESGKTPLCCLVSEQWEETPHQLRLIQLLLEKNPKLNIADKDKNTPVHIAAMRGCSGAIELFLNKQPMTIGELAVINSAKRNHLEFTPLDCAIESKSIRTMELLLGKANSYLQQSYDRAERLELTDIARLIQNKIKIVDPQFSLSSDRSESIRLSSTPLPQTLGLPTLIEQLKEFLGSLPSTSSDSSTLVDTSQSYAILLTELMTDLEDYSKMENKLKGPSRNLYLSQEPDSNRPISSSSSSSSSSTSPQQSETDKARQIEKSQKKHYKCMEMCFRIHEDIEFILQEYQTQKADDSFAQALIPLLSQFKHFLNQQIQQHSQLTEDYQSQLLELKAHGEATLTRVNAQDLPPESLQEVSNALSLGADVNGPNCRELLRQAVVKGSFEIVQLLSHHNVNMNVEYEDGETLFSLAVTNNRPRIAQFMIAYDPQIIANNLSFLNTPIEDSTKREIEQLRANISSIQQSVSTLTEWAFKNTEEIIALRKDVDKLNDINDVALRDSIKKFINHSEFGAYYRAFFEIFSAKMGNELLGLRTSLSNWVTREQSTVREGLSYIPKLGSLSPVPGASLAISLLMKIPDAIINSQEEEYLGNPTEILGFTEDYDHFVRLLAFYSLELFSKQLTYFDKPNKLSQDRYVVDKTAIDALVQSMVTRFFLFMFTKYFLDSKYLYRMEDKDDLLKQRAKSVVLSLTWFRPNKFSAFNFFKSIPGINQTVISLRTERDLTKYQKTKQIRHAGWRAIKGVKSRKADFEGFKGSRKQLTDQGLYRRALLETQNVTIFAKQSSRPQDYPSLHVTNAEVDYINQQIQFMDGMFRKNHSYQARPGDDPALRTMTISYREYYIRKFALLDQQVKEPIDQQPGTLAAAPIRSRLSGTSAQEKNNLTTISASSSSKVPKRSNLAEPLFEKQLLDPIRELITNLQDYQVHCLQRKIARLEGHIPGPERTRKCKEISDCIRDIHLLGLTQITSTSLIQAFERVQETFINDED